MRSRNVRFSGSPTSVQFLYCDTRSSSKVELFPEGTRGFIYYNVPPPQFPPIMGDLRFRITSSDDPSSFNCGSDLHSPIKSSLPWHYPLLLLAPSKKHEHLCEQLVAEGLVLPELLERCRLIRRRRNTTERRSSNENCNSGLMRRVLYHLNQPFLFPLEYHNSHFSLWVVGQEKATRCRLKNPFFQQHLTGMLILFQIKKFDI